MSDTQVPDPRDASAAADRRPVPLIAAIVIALVEAVALVVHCVAIAISASNTPGTVSAAPVEIVIYLVFAVGILACGRGLWRRRRSARTPFAVVQMFGLVVGWTLTSGDGDLTQRIGMLVLAVSVVAIALVISPQVGQSLES
ncbi:unannotated protein [freshwater metagenome]|uniref:Unannotated protein n=1 Tax=freshwater metagenome TaxID=449393 RepID=A0A6J7R1D1_9ZZZZ|nr:hypothetical protein [Actinomycetota bacterium]MSW37588.1 hypothetical protein [Actinomycetota bacterium]